MAENTYHRNDGSELDVVRVSSKKERDHVPNGLADRFVDVLSVYIVVKPNSY